MVQRGFSSDWCFYFVEIPWITEDGLPQCNAVKKLPLATDVLFPTNQNVFRDLQELFQVRFKIL